MQRSRLPRLCFIPILIFLVHTLSAIASTVAIGNCQPHLPSYHTISAAIDDVPAGSTVLVCPGTYPEQITITASITLRGVFPIALRPAIITVPKGGVVATQIDVEGTLYTPRTVVNLSNLVVDGSGSTGAVGIGFFNAEGHLSHLEVRNQARGIVLGSVAFQAPVTVEDSYIHEFDSIGVEPSEGGVLNFTVDLHRNLITSSKSTVDAGVWYSGASGTISESLIWLRTGIGLNISDPYAFVTARQNTISGADVGIEEIGFFGINVIQKNAIVGNSTGIVALGNAVLSSNAIAQSSVQAIDLTCSPFFLSVENNVIYSSPVGIANILPTDTITSNKFWNVATQTTECENPPF